MNRPSWNDYLLGIAQAVAARGDCRRSQVGAVLVRADRTLAATAYNGTPSGGPSCLAGECPRAFTDVPPGSSYDSGPGACVACHAEMNLIAFAREDTSGMDVYLTREACEGCLKLLRAARIRCVISPRSKVYL